MAFSERIRMGVRQVFVYLRAILGEGFFHSWNCPPSALSTTFWRHSFILYEDIKSNLWGKESVCQRTKQNKNLNKCFAKPHNRAVILKASTCIRITWETYLKCKFPFPSPDHWSESQEWGGDVRLHSFNSSGDALIH